MFSLAEALESAAALAGFRGAEYLPSLGLAALGADGGGCDGIGGLEFSGEVDGV